MAVESFAIKVSDDTLTDLRRRLAAIRWPEEVDGAGWDYGTNVAYMKSLASYWLRDYDWRQQEERLNRFSHYRAAIDGLRIHFLHEKGKGPSPLPLVMTHGWPGSFAEMLKIIPLLTDPVSHGGNAEDAFDVVVPSLPGFAFSDAPPRWGMTPGRIADIWASLMAELGYRRFAAQGGDWGAAVSSAIGLQHADEVVGIHLNFIAGRFLVDSSCNDAASVAFLDRHRAWSEAEAGYSHQQGTKPQTLSFGLTDSPIGLAAWVIEKFRAWTDWKDDFERTISRDELLTNVMLYWVTGSINTSMRIYYESRERPLRLTPSARVTVPVGFAVFPRENPMPPREIVERGFNVTRWAVMPKGGHFAAMEQPELLANELREFFRPLRRQVNGASARY